MAFTSIIAFAGLTLGAAAQSTAGAYGQCGGSGYTGPTACVSAYTCTTYNDYYAQCIPGSATATTITTTTTTAAAAATTTTTTTTTSATAAASSGTATLSSGWYWIRAVESPYYHSYLQSQPAAAATPAPAVMDSPATAGQFNIIDGQLVYNTGNSSSSSTTTTTDALYMWVEDPADKTQRALSTWFNTTANPYGTFAFSGDTVAWVDPDVSRPNTGAFYVCPNATTAANDLYINTGAYDYLTPSGCYDVDIHSYGAATATV